MQRPIDALLRWLYRSGLRRGMSGQHWAWFLLAGAAFLLRRARKPDDKVAKMHLRSGDRYVIEVRDGKAKGRKPRSGGRPQPRGTGRPRVVWHGGRISTATDHAE